ncbi:protein of unknown function [Xenorhabdus poinarii G6]|uniref:Uncharacterized protein n=1 Tax=Xenorhabdus poinarii G6 TaxID=1354304 RepID=A0A068R2V2_9GAMM|nr:protein of unknown function [Xenorhabdus poinarii G6]
MSIKFITPRDISKIIKVMIGYKNNYITGFALITPDGGSVT